MFYGNTLFTNSYFYKKIRSWCSTFNSFHLVNVSQAYLKCQKSFHYYYSASSFVVNVCSTVAQFQTLIVLWLLKYAGIAVLNMKTLNGFLNFVFTPHIQHSKLWLQRVTNYIPNRMSPQNYYSVCSSPHRFRLFYAGICQYQVITVYVGKDGTWYLTIWITCNYAAFVNF